MSFLFPSGSGCLCYTGLVNPSCIGLIGSGCVVHVPSFFEELDALESEGTFPLSVQALRFILIFNLGLDCTGRLFVSDRAQLVFDFHQIVDGLKEVELGGSRYFSSSSSSILQSFLNFVILAFQHLFRYHIPSPTPPSSIGTTKKGIGPAYSGKASRSGLRVHHLFNPDAFAAKFRKVVEGRFKRYGHFEYDTEGEIVRYKVGRISMFFACLLISP